MSRMLVPTIVMAAIAGVLVVAGFVRGQGEQVTGLRAGAVMTVQVLPLLLFAFVAAGMAQVMIPSDVIAKWMGAESGLRGIWLGTLAGALIPGGPYVSLPVAAGFLRAGAGVGTLVAFVGAWSLVSVARLPMEVGLLGWRFTAVRLACTFFVAPVAGWLAQTLFAGFNVTGGALPN